MKPTRDVVTLRARVEQLEDLCGALYQFAGEVGAPVRFLDALWAAAQGKPVDTSALLPVYAHECEEVQTLRRQLDGVRQIVAVGPAAAELGRAGGSRTSAAKRRAARANGRKGGRPRRAVSQ
jgi:hypothetical protein